MSLPRALLMKKYGPPTYMYPATTSGCASDRNVGYWYRNTVSGVNRALESWVLAKFRANRLRRTSLILMSIARASKKRKKIARKTTIYALRVNLSIVGYIIHRPQSTNTFCAIPRIHSGEDLMDSSRPPSFGKNIERVIQ